MNEISLIGALSALVIAVIMIFCRSPPLYGMLGGAMVGGIIGGADFFTVLKLMFDGSLGIMPAVIRVLAAGVLTGVLMESGAAATIALKITKVANRRYSVLAVSFATMVLTAAGVFVDIAVITVAPIGLAMAAKTGLSRSVMLLAMIGGGKCGNIISPNPNAIAAAEAFDISLTSVMAAGIIPALAGIIATYLIIGILKKHNPAIGPEDTLPHPADNTLPAFSAALAAPMTAIFLLSLRPIAGINIDPAIALPAGGMAGALAMGRIRRLKKDSMAGLRKMSGIAVMLIAAGALAGTISHSNFKDIVTTALQISGLPPFTLAPFSGALMSAVTASTTAGTMVAANLFLEPILNSGTSAIGGAAMIHAGATVFDSMPHGSFFHITAGAASMNFKERLKILPYECTIGLTLAAVSLILYGIFEIFP